MNYIKKGGHYMFKKFIKSFFVLAILAIGVLRIKEKVYVLRKVYPRTCQWLMGMAWSRRRNQ